MQELIEQLNNHYLQLTSQAYELEKQIASVKAQIVALQQASSKKEESNGS